jgi:hypothetical protein
MTEAAVAPGTARPGLVRYLMVAGALAFILAGCSGVRKLTREEISKGSLVFMYIDYSKASGWLDWVQFKQVAMGEAPQYWRMGIYKDSIVWFDGLPNGSYQLHSYGGSNGIPLGPIRLFATTNYSYNFPGQGSGFRIKEQGTYFLGSFKHVKAGSGKFDLESLNTPTEREVLTRLIKAMKSENSPLLHVAERRLRQLK